MRPSPIESADLAALAEALVHFEAELELDALTDQERLYDPDGTLYAISLGDRPVVLMTDRRRQPVGPGDLVVVPREVAIDVEPAGRFLGIRTFGPPPFHFRERFIQVHGFEHLGRPESIPLSARVPVLMDPARHRLSYEVGRGPNAVTADAFEAILVVPLELNSNGAATVGPARLRIGLLQPGETFAWDSDATVGLVRVLSNPALHAARELLRRRSERPLSPEPGG